MVPYFGELIQSISGQSPGVVPEVWVREGYRPTGTDGA